MCPLLVIERDDEIEVSSKNVDGIGRILSEPMEKIQEGDFMIMKLWVVDIGDPAINIGAKRVEKRIDGVVRG